VLDQNVEEEKDDEFMSMEEVAKEQSKEIPTVEQLLDEVDKQNKAVQETPKSPYDTESKIKVVKSYFTSHIPRVQDQIMHDSDESADVQEDSDYESMPEDDLRSVLGFEAADFDNTQGNDVSHSDHIFQDDNAFAECLSLPDHMDHICEESDKFSRLETELSKTLKSDMGKSLTSLVKSGMKKVKDDLNSQAKSLGKFCLDVKKHLLNSKEQQKSIQEFTDQLFKTTSSRFSPTPSKEPTRPKDSSKEGPLSQEEYDNQIKELKRISDLKAEKETSEQELRKLLNPATLKAQAQKWTEHEAKKAKMMEEKEATMKITRGDNPLNLIIHPNFRLKMLGFNEWLEAKRLGLPPPPKLVTFRLTAEEKKRKRTEFIKEVFLSGDVRVDGMDRNLIPLPRVLPIQEIRLRVREPLSGGIRGEEDQQSAKHQLAVKGLSEGKASESNIRRIQVKDIVKEVKDYLKTYLSAGMDISWYVEVIC
ncbi:hypothetical protein Tco_0468554, partial [Tanacetum coccineum]